MAEKPRRFEFSPKLISSGEGKRLQILAETDFLKLRGAETGGNFTLTEG